MEKKYYKQIDMGGTHHYLVTDEGVTHVVTHINHLSGDRSYLINNLEREGFENVLEMYGGVSEEISQEDFEAALKTAIFELNLYSFIKTN